MPANLFNEITGCFHPHGFQWYSHFSPSPNATFLQELLTSKPTVMKKILFLFFAMVSARLQAQTFSDYFRIGTEDYKIESTIESNGTFKFSLSNAANAKQDFAMNPLKMDHFISTGVEKVKALLPAGTVLTAAEINALKDELKKQFYNIAVSNLLGN